MPKLIKSTLLSTHKIGLKVIGTLLVISLVLAIVKNNTSSISPGNWRVIFWFLSTYINYKLLGKIDRKWSATLLLLTCLLSFYIYPLLPISSNYAENLFLLPSTLIVFSVLPYLIFDLANEKTWVFSWIAILSMFFWIAMKHTTGLIDPVAFEGVIIIFNNYTMLSIAFIASWLFIQIMFYRYVINIEKQNQRISKVNLNLDEKVSFIAEENKTLDQQSKKLIVLQEEIKSLNDKLELEVKLRTQELELQTEALNKYGFANSNLVRGPIESIIKKGKNTLMEDLKDTQSLKSIMQDLDAITRAISDVLNLKSTESIKAVEKMIKKKYSLK